MEKLIIFGAGKIAEAVSYFIERESKYGICAYICDKAYIQTERFNGHPVCPADEIASKYPPGEYLMFVAIGYQGLNCLRMEKFEFYRSTGYKFISCKGHGIDTDLNLGQNSIVMDGAVIQPCAKIGNNVFVWGGALIGHHARIEDNCWITGGAAVGGVSKIGRNTFLGLNATIGNEVNIGSNCMLGAGTVATKNVPDNTVLACRDTEPHRLNSSQFLRISSCFKTGY